jgi:hypothetical protein
MVFPIKRNEEIEAYIESVVPQIFEEQALEDAQNGVYAPPVWLNRHDEFVRKYFGKLGASPEELENMIKIGRENYKVIAAIYNKMYEECQRHEAQAA